MMGYANNYQNKGGYNRQQGGGYYGGNGGYNNNYQPEPIQSPQEFAKERLEMFMLFLTEAEQMGIKSDELIASGVLGGWITSYMLKKQGK